jgi:hypothetical protein
MRKRLLLPFLLLVMAVAAGWKYRQPLTEWWQTHVAGLVPREKPVPDPKTYALLISEVERWRTDLATRHRAARTATEREAVEREARSLLEMTLPAMMQCWLGTPWDFHGTAKGPGQGKIACGYFVATVLQDAGFKVDRYKLAQQPSENILRSFLPKSSCTLTVGKAYQAFAADVEKLEPGIYVVGLDTHVAFLVVRADGFRFIHSSGSRPWCVVDESRAQASVLQRSNWRMLGNLTASPAVLKRWLNAEKIPVHGT